MENTKEILTELMLRQEPLCDELQPYIQQGSFGEMIHHPLVIEIFYRPEFCGLINERYRQKKKALTETAEAGKWESYIYLHERPYRIYALRDALKRGAQPHKLVKSIWSDSENIYQNKARWTHIWSSLKNPHDTMDDNEKVVFGVMPETVTIHRGIRRKNYSPRGLSWTRDKERAVWFAHRHTQKGDKPVVLTADVEKKNILAFFNCRNEEEVVVLPKHLLNVR